MSLSSAICIILIFAFAIPTDRDITAEAAKKHSCIKVIGLVGTIDNDFPGANMTIGVDSALQRILEAVNAIASTAYSHKRTFILEVMGRHCGYLALKTALTTEADYVFLPEMPPPVKWFDDLARKINISSIAGKRLHLIILAEGATDIEGKPITAAMVQEYAASKLGLDARITVLGHVQRGGSPTAFDRILGNFSNLLFCNSAFTTLGIEEKGIRNNNNVTNPHYINVYQTTNRTFIDWGLMANMIIQQWDAEAGKNRSPRLKVVFCTSSIAKSTSLRGSRSGGAAVVALMELKPEDEPLVIAMQSNRMKKLKLEESIRIIKQTKEAIENKRYDEVLKLRGRSFVNNFQVFKALNKLVPACVRHEELQPRIFAILQVGTPACGINAAVFSFVRHACHRGGKVFGIYGGIQGLLSGQFQRLRWGDVHGWVLEGGSFLGTRMMIPNESMYSKIAENLGKFNIEALCVIGGFEAFCTTYNFLLRRKTYPEFCIPMMVIPATINNNVPGSEFSIGADTALNTITKACDLFRQSAMGTKSRVFIVETMGGKCGYLCSMGAIASGADASYIFEEPFTIDDLRKDVNNMISKMKRGKVLRGLILRNEDCNENYTTDFIANLFSEEGKEAFTTRKNILGHIQQGDIPSSFDRTLGVKLGAEAIAWAYENFDRFKNENGKIFTQSMDSVVMVGLFGDHYCNTPLENLLPHVDFANRDARCKMWMSLRPLIKILALHESNYVVTD